MSKPEEQVDVRINGLRVDVVKVDADAVKGCLILHHSDGTETEVYLDTGMVISPH